MNRPRHEALDIAHAMALPQVFQRREIDSDLNLYIGLYTH